MCRLDTKPHHAPDHWVGQQGGMPEIYERMTARPQIVPIQPADYFEL